MSVRRAPPGAQISSGRIRVDAARAIAKLREYRLADPNAWILEAVRAAVGSGATRIALDADADDIRLVWAGPAWPAEVLPELFDELVSPEASRDVYPRRLLAGAVNSALGLEPAWVDVIAVSGGAASRVRFTPATVTPGEDGAAPLRDLDVESVAVPDGASDPGMHVQLRRRVGLEMFGRFLTGGEPPELALARWACRDIAVPMRIGGSEVGRAVHRDDLVRVPLGEGLDGFVALAHPGLLRGTPPVPAMDVAELGVRVVRERWTPSSLETAWGQNRATLPVRLVIDGARMPTNASRSQVRAEDHPVAAALRRGDEQVTALLEEIATRLGTLAKDVDRTETFADPSAELSILRAAALAVLAPAIAGVDWNGDATALKGPLLTLAKLPLVRNAVGGWRAPAEYWRGPTYRGSEALPRELSPWIGTMAWIPAGDAAEVLLGGSRPDARDARRAIKSARRRLSARKEFLGRPAQEARVAPRAESRVRARLSAVLESAADAKAFAGLDGEVCVAHARGPGRLALHHEGRVLATAVLDTPVAVDAIVSGALLAPDERYRGVAVDSEFRRAERAVRVAAMRAIEALADDRARPGVEISAPRRAAGDDELLLIALSMAREDGIRVVDDSPLANADVFHAPDGVRHSLASLRRERVIAVANRADEVVPPAGRLLILATPAEHQLLAAMLAPETAVVPYGKRHAIAPLDPGLTLTRMIAGRTGMPALVRRDGALAGGVGFEPREGYSTLSKYHRGQSVELVMRDPAHLDCSIAIDCDTLVPSEDWSNVVDDGGIAQADLAGWERELLRATVRALLGDIPIDLVIPQRPIRLDDATGHALCRALGEGAPRELLGDELTARLRDAPILRVLGGDGPCSIDRLCAAFGDDLPAIDPDAAADATELDGWHPLVADDVVRAMVATVSGRKVVDATDQIVERRRAAARRRKLAEHRRRPTEAMELPAAHAPMTFDVNGVRGVIGIGDERRLEAVVLVEGRRFARIVSNPDLPLRAVVELPIESVDLERGEVGATANGNVLAAIRASAGPWLAHIAGGRAEMLADDLATRTLLAEWLRQNEDGHRAVRDALRAARAWPTIQGGRASLAAAANGPTVPTAAWSGEWLTGDPADPLDGPVLAVPTGGDGDALRGVLDGIGPWPTDDVTALVRRLQVRRRVQSGKVPSPTVEGAPRELTRRLEELDVHHTLGAGEIALDDATGSQALLHFDGQYRAAIPIDVVPAVRIAIEAPDLVDEMAQPGGVAAAHREHLARQAQQLALALVTQVAIASDHGVAIPPWLRRRFASALLAQRLEPARVAALPLFMTMAGTWMTWNDVLSQESMFGDVWYLTGDAGAAPLDNRRRVLVLSESNAALASRFTGVTFVDGSRELTLDAQARRNLDRPPLPRLEVPAQVRGGGMAPVELVTTGSRRRGYVVPLRPAAISLRGLNACRGLVPFERMADPCAWPTFAVVEDPDLQGDRTWRRPAEDAVWKSLAEDVRATSEAAIRAWLSAPSDALVSELVETWHIDRESSLWDQSLVRGVVWIDPAAKLARAGGHVMVSTAHGDIEIDAPPDAPLWGRLYVAPEPRGLVDAVKTLCRARYDQMARAGGVWREPERAPEVDAQGVYTGGGTKRRRETGGYEGVGQMSSTLPPPRAEWLPEPRPKSEPPPEPAHWLQPVVDKIRRRLDDAAPIGSTIKITIDRTRNAPAVALERDRIVLAGESELMRAVGGAHEERMTWADGAADAVAAHCMTLVNQERAPIDDSHERAALQYWLETP